MPALIACGQLALLQPATWPIAFQSETMKPSKPILSFNASVSSALSPCSLPWSWPVSAFFQLLNEAITVCAPAPIAPK